MDNLEKGAELAKETLAKMQANKVPQGEPKGASEVTQPKAVDQQKTEELVKKAQEQAEVNADERVKKQADGQAKPDGDKVERRKDEIQKEINALIAQRNALKSELGNTELISREIADLRTKVSELERVKVQEKPVELQQKEVEAEQIKRYLDEDKDKPRGQRREMSGDELGSWLAEDFEAAQEWMTERSLRRREERTAFISKLENEKAKRAEDDIKVKQSLSAQRAKSKFPDMANAEEEYNNMIKDGKTAQEARAAVSTNYPFYNALIELYAKEEQAAHQENRKNRYMSLDNGPELLAQEAHDKVSSLPKGRMYSEAEVEELLKNSRKTPPATISSSRPSDSGKSGNDEEIPETMRKYLKKAGISPEVYLKNKKRRENIPGAA